MALVQTQKAKLSSLNLLGKFLCLCLVVGLSLTVQFSLGKTKEVPVNRSRKNVIFTHPSWPRLPATHFYEFRLFVGCNLNQTYEIIHLKKKNLTSVCVYLNCCHYSSVAERECTICQISTTEDKVAIG